MKKILVLVIKRALDSYRVNRIIEEAKKLDCQVDLLCSSKAKILADGIYSNDIKINFNDYGLVYSIGNDEKHQYILTLANYNSSVRIWPDDLLMNDKFVEGIFLSSIDVPIPKTALLLNMKETTIKKTAGEVGGYPCVIKKVTGSEGKYVFLANSDEEVLSFLENLPHPSIVGRKNIIFQEYIKESKGSDFRVFCVGNEILGAIKRTSQNDDFRANISLGGKAEQMQVTKGMRNYSEKIIRGGKFLFLGIDFIKSNEGYRVIELNDSADFSGFEKATGINVAGKIIDKFLEKK